MRFHPKSCCGLREISGLSDHCDSAEAMQAFCGSVIFSGYLRCSHAIFSEARGMLMNDGPYGERFAAYIRRHNLGTVTASKRVENPNSGNQLKVWVWTINKRNLRAWARKH
jgi:hypothetical protein